MTYTRTDQARPGYGQAGGTEKTSGIARQVSMLMEMIGRAFERWSNRRAIYKLSLLEDRHLHDIGITRADVTWALSLPGDVDASVALSDLVQCRRDAARWARAFRAE